MFMVGIVLTAYMVNSALILVTYTSRVRSPEAVLCYPVISSPFPTTIGYTMLLKGTASRSRLLKFPPKNPGQFREEREDCLTIACLSWRG